MKKGVARDIGPFQARTGVASGRLIHGHASDQSANEYEHMILKESYSPANKHTRTFFKRLLTKKKQKNQDEQHTLLRVNIQ